MSVRISSLFLPASQTLRRLGFLEKLVSKALFHALNIIQRSANRSQTCLQKV
ncbi:hypothetical protein [Caudoviricetes sp.]|nr:hypothetical protein [Caudoviricetes sp.]UOF81537.1 hypothetical protein [Caudoviricetes sp.]